MSVNSPSPSRRSPAWSGSPFRPSGRVRAAGRRTGGLDALPSCPDQGPRLPAGHHGTGGAALFLGVLHGDPQIEAGVHVEAEPAVRVDVWITVENACL
jgi:hypothetical protein